MARNTMHGQKVPIFKTWWFWVIIILFIYGFISGVRNNDEEAQSEQIPETGESSDAGSFSADAQEDGLVCIIADACDSILQ